MDEWETRPHVQNFLKVVAKKQGISEYTITSLTRTEKGEGYSGIIFMITIKDNSSDRELDLVIKSAFTEEKQRNFLPIADSYANEIYFFTVLKPALNKFIIRYSRRTPIEMAAHWYQVHAEVGKEMLCLENLKTSNFEVFDKKLILDDEHFSFIFKYYGRFHGYSFAWKDREPKEFAKFVGPLRKVFEQFTTIPEGYFKKFLIEISNKIVRYLKVGEDDEIIRKYEKYQDGGIIDLFQKTVTDHCEHTTILHGDCWSNNMMFKYETSENGRKLVDMRLLDLQIVRDASPVCDLSYCLYSGGSKAQFDNLDEYFKIYYESLSMTLQEFGCDVKTIYPFHLLKDHWKRYARLGMAMTFAILKLKCTNKEDIVDLTDDIARHIAARSRYNTQDFKTRVKEVLYHMSKMDAL